MKPCALAASNQAEKFLVPTRRIGSAGFLLHTAFRLRGAPAFLLPVASQLHAHK